MTARRILRLESSRGRPADARCVAAALCASNGQAAGAEQEDPVLLFI